MGLIVAGTIIVSLAFYYDGMMANYPPERSFHYPVLGQDCSRLWEV